MGAEDIGKGKFLPTASTPEHHTKARYLQSTQGEYMRNFVFGFFAGAATYHYVSGGFNNAEMIKDLRNAIQKVDDRLAEKDKNATTEPVRPSPPSTAA